MCFTVTAQEGPGIVIAHPGQDVELLCNVTEDLTTLTEGWLINNMGPYGINALYHGRLIGHNGSLDGGNLIVEHIMMNDSRSGSEYICVIVPADLDDIITIADIIYRSEPTFLYVSGEYIRTCSILTKQPACKNVRSKLKVTRDQNIKECQRISIKLLLLASYSFYRNDNLQGIFTTIRLTL